MKLSFFFIMSIFLSTMSFSQNTFYHSKDFTVTSEKVIQGNFEAKALSPTEINSSYKSIYKKAAQNKLEFKFSLNGMDNERGFAQNHQLILKPVNGKMISPIFIFGQADTSTVSEQTEYLNEDIELTLRVDMRKLLKDFNEHGYYELFNSEKFYKKDFNGVFVAGNIEPLSWDFQTLGTKKQFQLTDENNDGIYELKLLIKKDIVASDEDKLTTQWKLTKDLSAYPQLQSSSVLLDALYNQAIEEMLLDVRNDGAFMAGEKWPGVWTRDISYSIHLAFAIINPDAAKTSLLAKVKNGKIIQDTGTGGAWPVSSDRMTWALAAWEIYKVTGDKDWLKKSFSIIKNSALADLETVRDKQTGLFNGESSFLDWREQTYPLWMDPKDIYASKNLGTNAVHFQTYKILTMMASELHEDAAQFISAAKGIQDGMNKLMWMPDEKYFGQYLYGRNYQSLSPKSEALGEALSVLFEIPNAKRQKEIVENTPVTKFGIPCVYPQTPNIPPYHNDAVWAFVEAYWTMASAKVKNETSVEHGLASLYRAAALFLTNKENFVASSGDYVGTQINSNRQLWSVAGNLAMTYRVFFGMQFEPDKLIFAPFIPKNFSGERTLSNFKYRNSTLTISVKGFGDGIKSFKLDGKILKHNFIEASLVGKHSIEIVMNGKTSPSKINLVENEYAPETPKVKLIDGKLTWEKIPDAVNYIIFKNGKKITSTKETNFSLPQKSLLVEYQVKAVDKNNVASFLSEPVTINGSEKIIEMEDYVSSYENKFANYSGKGYVKIEKQDHRDISFPFTAEKAGIYTIDFRYANGNGPLNTENKCAIRSLLVDTQFAGAIVMPHRGENTWNVFDYSNSVQIYLTKGEHIFTLTFRSSDENMNGEVNGALLDHAKISLLK
ncbi:MAG: glycogen debranching protein [Ignavibacteria bacterium]|nr:glycogen debranching protein [Ignavibacteria bacterium]